MWEALENQHGKGHVGYCEFLGAPQLVQDETQPRVVLCHKYFVASWPELTVLRRWP